MGATKPAIDTGKEQRKALFRTLIVPVCVLLFYLLAPRWLDHRIHHSVEASIRSSGSLSDDQRLATIQRFAAIDFEKLALSNDGGDLERIRQNLVQSGTAANFQRFKWCQYASIFLVAGLVVTIIVMRVLNGRAARSKEDLIRAYKVGWRLGIAAAICKVFLLIPLLTYASFELTVLAFDQYFPKLLIIILIGGIVALVGSIKAVLAKPPDKFKENLSREVTDKESPELWRVVRYAAEKLKTAPPDAIVVGMQLNFYVTELGVIHDSGTVAGRTLFLSLPLLKHLSEQEVIAIIGHELGHFIGEDTRMTREFIPLRFKARGTIGAMARSGWVGWAGLQPLLYFNWCFSETEQAHSRKRELAADQKAAELTSPQTAAKALVRFQVFCEAFQRGVNEAIQTNRPNALDVPVMALVRDKLAGETTFWSQLFEKVLPHPLDSHPSLRVRLDSLGQQMSPEQARDLAMVAEETASARWFPEGGGVLQQVEQKAAEHIDKVQAQTRVKLADYSTEEGKRLLDAYFPEKRYAWKSGSFYASYIFGMLGILSLTALGVGAMTDVKGVGLSLLILVAGLASLWVIKWKRHYSAVLSLTAGGLSHSGWYRTLLFKDVARITAQKSYGQIYLYLHLKEKQPTFWKTNLVKFGCKKMTLSLNGFQGKSTSVV